MATGSKSGGPGGSGPNRPTGGDRRTGSRRRKSTTNRVPRGRVTSKPLIIDIEAEADASQAKTSQTVASQTVSKAATGLDENTARAAGLSAAPLASRSADAASESVSAAAPIEVKTDTASEPSEAAAKTASSIPADGPVPPAGNADASGGGPSAFYIFSAGLLGALAALVLLFLAQLFGLVASPGNPSDEQASALHAVEQRLDARLADLESLAQSSAEGAPINLEPLQEELASLAARVEAVTANASSGNAETAPLDIDQLVADALQPLDARITALEEALDAQAQVANSADGETPLAVAPSVDLSEVNGAIAALQNQVNGLQTAEPVPASQTLARLDALDGISASAVADIEDATLRVAALETSQITLSDQLTAVGDQLGLMGEQITALANAPVAVTPDRLARLGLALDGLIRARDQGLPVDQPLAAARAAASFDAGLAGAFEGLQTVTLPDDLSDAGLLDVYNGARAAMLAAAPTDTQSSGLLGALEERARQMVSIRAPEGTVRQTRTVSGQIDQLGGLMASGHYDEAQAALAALPEAVQSAGGAVGAVLAARIAVDDAVAASQERLMAALSIPPEPSEGQAAQ